MKFYQKIRKKGMTKTLLQTQRDYKEKHNIYIDKTDTCFLKPISSPYT